MLFLKGNLSQMHAFLCLCQASFPLKGFDQRKVSDALIIEESKRCFHMIYSTKKDFHRQRKNTINIVTLSILFFVNQTH